MTLTSTAPDQVISDLEWWLGRKWPMTRAEACAQAAEIGWKLDDGQLVTDYDVQDPTVLGLAPDEKTVSEFTFELTDRATDDDQSATDLIKDRFSDYATAGRSQWGKSPLLRARRPAIRWDLAERGGIRIWQGSAVFATVMSPDQVSMLKSLNDW